MPFRKGGPNPGSAAKLVEHGKAKTVSTATQNLDEAQQQADNSDPSKVDHGDGQALYDAFCAAAKPGVWYLIPGGKYPSDKDLQRFTVAKLLRKKPHWVRLAFNQSGFFRHKTYSRIVVANRYSGRQKDGSWIAVDACPRQTVAEQLRLLTCDQQLLDKQYSHKGARPSVKPDRPRFVVRVGRRCLSLQAPQGRHAHLHCSRATNHCSTPPKNLLSLRAG